MASCTFPYNPVLESMRYTGQELTIVFKKKDGKQERTYAEVPKEIAYGLLYKKTASEVLSFFAKEIRQKFKVVDIR